MEGVRYGALIGVLLALPTSVDAFVIYPITEQLAVIWFFSTVVSMMIAGALFSAIYKPSG
jgi:phosphate/sulfate permease